MVSMKQKLGQQPQQPGQPSFRPSAPVQQGPAAPRRDAPVNSN